MKAPERMGLYIHVPFCVRKCAYCDFLSFPMGGEAGAVMRQRYVDALCREIQAGIPETAKVDQKGESTILSTIFFGGGTPSLLTGSQIQQIMDTVRQVYPVDPAAEITMEANPGTLTYESLTAYRQAGINRLSIGLQSAQNDELQLLGRIHTWEAFVENYQAAREAGFANINVDLMSALPGQNLATWEDTMQKVLALKPEHISAYSLIIEPGTPFYDKYGEDEDGQENGETLPEEERLPEEDVERLMYEVTEKHLNQAGFYRYEISNYARPGYESRHNCSYWERIPYLGVGLGASSHVNEIRWRNQDELSRYLEIWESEETTGQADTWLDVEELTTEDQMAEMLFLGMRQIRGIREQDFFEKFGKTLDEVYGEVLARQEQLGLILRQDGWLRLTPYGVDVSNQVFCEYL